MEQNLEKAAELVEDGGWPGLALEVSEIGIVTVSDVRVVRSDNF